MTANSSTTAFKILVDADSCPVKDIIVEEAVKTATRVLMVASVSHQLAFEESEISVITVDNLPQAADMAVLNNVSPGDIVVTGDYGLASLVLAKSATPVSPRGFIYTNGNIDRLLIQRHIDAKIRRAGGRTKGPRAFDAEDRKHFRRTLQKLLLT
ncbi:MAG: YaiI/YqxD family protein [Thermincola sp.]|nr:YaiI/YqxD family protein [Thermincola sp.]